MTSTLNGQFWILILLLKFQGFTNLKNVRLKTNSAVKAGDNLLLQCDYDLENALLYSIKWYFGDNEFYRFVPKESPPTRVFPVPGITVDLSKSDNKAVVLRNVQRDLTGFYKCEVSADAPLFHTDIKSAIVIVAGVPEKPPSIFSEKNKYHDTEMITIVCTAGRSYPAANITWYNNGQVLDSRSVKMESSISSDSDGLEISSSKLEILIPANPGIFQQGKLKLKCRVHQFDIYDESVQTEIADDTPQLAHVLSPTPINSGSLNTATTLMFGLAVWLYSITICS